MAYLRASDDRLLFLPLGGSGEIGMNLNLYGHKGKWLMVDCGMSFADPGTPGIDLIFPDPGFIEDEQEDLVGLVVTHGHEDHIGAVPHLWSRFRCPVYATPFTAELIKDKLAEAGLLEQVPLIVVNQAEPFELGPFKVTYVPLAHSIAEGHGLAIETSRGTIFHTGDWKLDDRPIIGPVCPSPTLQALGEKGVLALVGDSTNVFNESDSGSEAAVKESLMEIVGGIEERVVITTFASNVARLDTIGQVARHHGRHVVLLGRSMHRILKAAQATGYLTDFPQLVDEGDAGAFPKDKILIACTGCQGEDRAALARIARDDHKHLNLAPGDTVIFSSKIIPGNEITLGALFNQLVEKGVKVITEKDAFVHVSGHPGRSELRKMYGWTKPKCAIPVHGEARHLYRHAALALEIGVEHTIVPSNGDVIEISEDGLKLIDKAPVGRTALDGSVVVPADGASITDRRRLALNGYVAASVILDVKGRLAVEPLLALRGLPRQDDDSFYDSLVAEIEEALDRLAKRDRDDDDKVEEASRVAIRRYCRKTVGRNPVVDILITRQDEIDFD